MPIFGEVEGELSIPLRIIKPFWISSKQYRLLTFNSIKDYQMAVDLLPQKCKLTFNSIKDYLIVVPAVVAYKLYSFQFH